MYRCSAKCVNTVLLWNGSLCYVCCTWSRTQSVGHCDNILLVSCLVLKTAKDPTFTDSKLRPWYVPIVSILKPSVSVGKIKISTVTFLGQNRHQLQLWKEIVGINANCTCMYFPISVHRNTDKNSKNGFPLTSPHQCCEGLKNSSLFFLIVFFSSKTKLKREEGKCCSCPNFHGQSSHSFRSVSTVLSGIVHIVWYYLLTTP